MMKKVLAVVLAGVLTLGGAFSVLATEGAADTAGTEAASENEKVTPEEEAELEKLLGSLGVEEGSGDETGLGALIGLLSAFGGEEGSGDVKGLDSLLGMLGGAEGSGEDLGDMIGGLLGAFGTGEDGSGEDAQGFIEVIKVMAAGFLATLEEEGGKIAEIIAQFKNEDGTFDFSKMIEILNNSTESEDGTMVTIGDVEIASEELSAAVEKAAEKLAAEGEAQTEDAA